jgi:DNA gyrase subunit A
MCLRAVHGDEDVLIMTDNGITIRISLESVSTYGRNTQGVKLINVDDDAKVATVALISREEESEEESDEEEN